MKRRLIDQSFFAWLTNEEGANTMLGVAFGRFSQLTFRAFRFEKYAPTAVSAIFADQVWRQVNDNLFFELAVFFTLLETQDLTDC